MSWYIFALVDAIPSRSAGAGLAAPVAFRRAAGCFAVVERRADIPPVEFGSLRAHQAVVERLASRVPAILPVKFGTLLTTTEIEESLTDREEELEEALAFVRGRRQMTWRLRSARTRAARRGRDAPARRPASGADYLRSASRATKAPASGIFRRIADAAGRLAVAERYQQRTQALPDALYHLVETARLEAYADVSKRLRTVTPGASLTGPWAPYAFVPELF